MSRGIAADCAPSPANDSLSEMKNEVSRYVLMPDHNEVLEFAGQEIRNAIKRVNTRIWNWSKTFLDLTTVLDQADYTMAADFKGSFMLQRLDSSGEAVAQPLRYMEWKAFVFRYPTSTQSGTAMAYSIVNSIDTCLLSLNHPASQAMVDASPTLRHYYYRRLAELTLPNQRLVAPPEIELFVKTYAKEKAAMVFDPSKVSDARRDRFAVWNELVNDDLQVNTHDWRS